MKRFPGSFIPVLAFFALALASQGRADDKPPEGAKAVPPSPRAVNTITPNSDQGGT